MDPFHSNVSGKEFDGILDLMIILNVIILKSLFIFLLFVVAIYQEDIPLYS